MFRQMRRNKQQLDDTEVNRILSTNTSGVLSVIDEDGYPYTVPLSYVYTDGAIFFHSAKEGRKIDAIRNGKKATFCIVDKDEVQPEKYTTLYKSVIAFGNVKIVENADEAHIAIKKLANKYYPNHDSELRQELDKHSDKMLIIEFDVKHITGKQSSLFL